MAASNCGICNSDRTEDIETLALEAMEGRLSWREVARQLGLGHHQPLKNHMERHYVAPASPQEQALQEWPVLVASTIEELSDQLRFAPTEVKPFYLVAIQNLKGLDVTKPSQSNLINALKAIHEVTGMKMEQRMMLAFAAEMFGTPEVEATAVVVREIGTGDEGT